MATSSTRSAGWSSWPSAAKSAPPTRPRSGCTRAGQLQRPPGRRAPAWRPSSIELAFTPHYASWLNRIEAQFEALRSFRLAGTDHPGHATQARLINVSLVIAFCDRGEAPPAGLVGNLERRTHELPGPIARARRCTRSFEALRGRGARRLALGEILRAGRARTRLSADTGAGSDGKRAQTKRGSRVSERHDAVAPRPAQPCRPRSSHRAAGSSVR